MYNIIYEMSCQSRFDARYWMLGAGALGRPRGMVWGGRREKGSGWGTHVYLWRIHVDIWQNQYNIVKLKNKKYKKKKNYSEKNRKKEMNGLTVHSLEFPSAMNLHIIHLKRVRWPGVSSAFCPMLLAAYPSALWV